MRSERPLVAMIATHLAPAQGYGGVAESSARLAREWVAAGMRLEVCASDASQGGILTAGDVKLGPSAKVTLYHAHWFPRWGFGLGAPAVLWRVCRRAQAVYISGIATWPTTLAALFCIVLGRPFVVAPRAGLMDFIMRRMPWRKPHKQAFYQVLTLPSLRRARAIHATSQLEADQLRAHLPSSRVEVLGNGLCLDQWSPLPPRQPDGGLALCFVGRLAVEKGIVPFVQTWLTASGPHDTLTLVGSGPCEKELRSLAAGADGRISMVGYCDRDGVRAALAACDALVLPSLSESFGNVAAEAMASARPVLVSRGIGWDYLADSGAVVLLGDGTHGQAAALAHLAAQSPQQRQAMGEAARFIAQSSFDMERAARLLADAVCPGWLGSQPDGLAPVAQYQTSGFPQADGQGGVQG